MNKTIKLIYSQTKQPGKGSVTWGKWYFAMFGRYTVQQMITSMTKNKGGSLNSPGVEQEINPLNIDAFNLTRFSNINAGHKHSIYNGGQQFT